MPEDLKPREPGEEPHVPAEIMTQADTFQENPPLPETNIPEAKPVPEVPPQEKKAPDGLDLDGAKKRLEELYKNASIDAGVGLDSTQQPPKIEDQIIPEQPASKIEQSSVDIDKFIDVDKPIFSERPPERVPEQTEREKTPEQIAEEAKLDEKLQKQQIEDAKKDLEINLVRINKARSEKDRATERSFYDKSEASFKTAEGLSLKEKSAEKEVYRTGQSGSGAEKKI